MKIKIDLNKNEKELEKRLYNIRREQRASIDKLLEEGLNLEVLDSILGLVTKKSFNLVSGHLELMTITLDYPEIEVILGERIDPSNIASHINPSTLFSSYDPTDWDSDTSRYFYYNLCIKLDSLVEKGVFKYSPVTSSIGDWVDIIYIRKDLSIIGRFKDWIRRGGNSEN